MSVHFNVRLINEIKGVKCLGKPPRRNKSLVKLREAEKINPGLTSPTDGTDSSESAGNAIVISIRKDNINPMRF
jgi:hypothetical protein